MVEIRNLTKKNINTKELLRLAQNILKKEKKQDADISIVVVGAKRMQQLNKKHRKKNNATNVLAFSGDKNILGEIVLCPSVISKDALEYRISFKKAISWMFVHGLLHLLGYDHKTLNDEKKMIQKEKRYLL